jgi:signal transduction histidine kinase
VGQLGANAFGEVLEAGRCRTAPSACASTRPRTPGGWVEVDTDRAGPLTVVRVANSGPRSGPTQVAALFEPFRRLGGDRTGSARGAGLGLSIVRSVATAHGGQAEARALPGGGLEVTVGLPAG